MDTTELKVDDLTGRLGAARAALALQRVPGVRWVDVDLPRGIARVQTDLAGASVLSMLTALAHAGFAARPAATTAMPREPAPSTCSTSPARSP